MTPSPAWLRDFAATLDGRLILPGDADMVLANKQHAATLPFVPPAALIRCASVDDVVRCVTALGQAGHRFSLRSGGHCFADRSNAGPVVVDLAGLASITVRGDRTVVGAGVTAGQAVTHLAAHGRAIPTGGCIGVSVVGLALAGGFGFSGRRLGLLSDRVVRLEAVLADGSLVAIDADLHPDLYWALRGGGAAGLAAVTALEIETAPLVEGMACHAEWPLSEAVEIIQRWQHYAPAAPDHVNIELNLLASDASEEPARIRLSGGIAGSADAGLRRAFGRHGADIAIVPLTLQRFAEHLVGLRTFDGALAWQPSYPFARVGFQATRSQFLRDPLDRGAVETLLHQFDHDRRNGEAREIEWIPWGGAYRIAGPPSCFAHRTPAMLIRHTALGGSRCTLEQQAAIRQWVAASWEAAGATADGAYQGYGETRQRDYAARCFGPAGTRLAELKRRYDPTGVFGE